MVFRPPTSLSELRSLFVLIVLCFLQIDTRLLKVKCEVLEEGYSVEAVANRVDDLPGFGPPPSQTFSGCDTPDLGD